MPQVTEEYLAQKEAEAKLYEVKTNAEIKAAVEAKYADSTEPHADIQRYIHLDYLNELQSKFQKVNPSQEDVIEVVELINTGLDNGWVDHNNEDGFVATFVWVSERRTADGEPVLEHATLYKSLTGPHCHYFEAQYNGKTGYNGIPVLDMPRQGIAVWNATAAWMRITKVSARPNRYAGLEGVRHCDVLDLHEAG